MNVSFVVTVIGPDRPGLVSAIASRAAAHGASWMESSMAQLAGQFAGIVRLEVAEAGAAKLKATLLELEAEGLRLVMEQAAAPAATKAGCGMKVELVGHDRPGIVREISAVLARNGASIDKLDTDCESASFSGEPLFRARIDVHIPAAAQPAALKTALEALANELMVDITLEDSAPP